jgi:SNF2 family DNA or RNA helicase|tara:strand:- start:2301 stop:3764 length:1464 start_codon:yes stop_codon:yes gene_type:complete
MYPNFKTKPFNHQLQALGCSWDKRNFAYFMEMGTGKSKVLIDNIAMLYDQGKINAAVIIAPKGVYRNWERLEIPAHLPEHIQTRITTWVAPSSRKKEDEKKLKELSQSFDGLDIFLMNIEALAHQPSVQFLDRYLLGTKSLMAIDESTTIKSTTAKRTKNILKICKLAEYRRILTGSPVTKNPLDLYSQCHFLDEDLLGFSSYYAYKARYAIEVKRHSSTHSFNHIVGFRNLDELSYMLGKFSFRVLKEDCLDLPSKIYQPRYVEMTKEQEKAYNDLATFAITELEGDTLSVTNTMTMLLRLHQITCGYLPTDDGPPIPLKNNRLSEMLSAVEEVEGKIIIWANYRQSIFDIKEALSKKYGEDSVVTYFGDTKDKDRQDIVKSFQDPESPVRFFVANQQTGGYGLTLTQAHTVIYFSNNYDLEKRIQSEDRAHRIGQKNNVTYIDLISEKTVDENIVNSLRNKIDLASQSLGEKLKDWLIEGKNKKS